MIGLYNDAGARLPVTFNGLTLNSPTDAADSTYELNSVTTIKPTDGPLEARPAEEGAEVYASRSQMIILRFDGTVRGDSLADLYDRKAALAAAFDPAKASHEDATAHGVLALDFRVPTESVAAYVTGSGTSAYVASRYYARARQCPVPVDSIYTGNAAFFAIEMVVPDPRRYLQSESSLSGAGTATNNGDVHTPATLTITMAGAGSATYSVSNDPTLAGIATSTLTLDLSGMSASDVVVVDMDSRTITKNGTSTPSIYVSGSFFPIERGANAITYGNTTNATSVLTWRSAWAV